MCDACQGRCRCGDCRHRPDVRVAVCVGCRKEAELRLNFMGPHPAGSPIHRAFKELAL